MTGKENVTETTYDLKALRAELLRAEIDVEKARAELIRMDVAERYDQERDRLVKTGRIRHLPIRDVITGTAADQYIGALEHWERRDPGEDILITINSPGGSVTDGLALYDTIMRLRRKGHKVTTRGMGLVASMAAVLLQAGDHRIIDQRAKLMIHEGATTMRGSMTVGEADDYRAVHDMLLDDIATILTERSKLTKAQLKQKWRRKDWYLSAAEALKYGFADVIE